jgi:hypothetical protein
MVSRKLGEVSHLADNRRVILSGLKWQDELSMAESVATQSVRFQSATYNWKRLGQFTARKVQLLQRSTGLLVKPHPGLSFLLPLRGRNDLFPPAPDSKKYRWGFQQEFFDESEP